MLADRDGAAKARPDAEPFDWPKSSTLKERTMQNAAVAISTPANVSACATVPLSRPLKTHQGDVREIVLRKPQFGEFIEIGPVENLVFSNADGEARQMESKIDLQRLMRWASRLSNIDQIVLSTLDPIDGYNLSKAVVEAVNVFVVGNLNKPQSSSG
ncbi:hypothetical protein [Hyphomicrobium sp. LHD-15]|uniref:hypothetical protein n=1 Tax=Hyphomicrobium sp. LHD-15 TaxID=3072142 RepID=UPI00280CB1B2|nr:hypothetical protein [Hyphomicrobium sp. LHD-15]MDQ8700219.1 hypothetical protein [Hyphomicrobium sp. LHD-15]